MSQAKDYICDLTPYQPGLPIERIMRESSVKLESIIRLDSNENPLGPSPKARAAFGEASKTVNRYPEQFSLVSSLARHYGVDSAMVVVGNGSNDILDIIARTYLGAGDEAISTQYSFAIYAIATQSTGARNVVVPAKSFGHDLPAMLRAITPRTKLIWIDNPGNPTGTFVPYAELREFLREVPAHVMVVLDEAYYEYLDDTDQADSISWLKEHPNLIPVRTFSKIYGLAGLRVGFCIAAPEVAELLNRVRQPYNVNNLALVAAKAALTDREFVERSRNLVQEGKRLLIAELRELHLETLPAFGNFISFRAVNGQALRAALLSKGVIIRPLDGYGMTDWLRLTVGLPEENKRFIEVLKACL